MRRQTSGGESPSSKLLQHAREHLLVASRVFIVLGGYAHRWVGTDETGALMLTSTDPLGPTVKLPALTRSFPPTSHSS